MGDKPISAINKKSKTINIRHFKKDPVLREALQKKIAMEIEEAKQSDYESKTGLVLYNNLSPHFKKTIFQIHLKCRDLFGFGYYPYYETHSYERNQSMLRELIHHKKEKYFNDTLSYLNSPELEVYKNKIDEFISGVASDNGCLFIDGENLLYNFFNNEDLSILGRELNRDESKRLIKHGSNENLKYCIFFLQKNKSWRERDINKQLELAGFTNILIIFTQNTTEVDDILLIYAFFLNLKNRKHSTIISNDRFSWLQDGRSNFNSSNGIKLEINEILPDEVAYVPRELRIQLPRIRYGYGKKPKKQITRTKPKPKKPKNQRTRTKPKPKSKKQIRTRTRRRKSIPKPKKTNKQTRKK